MTKNLFIFCRPRVTTVNGTYVMRTSIAVGTTFAASMCTVSGTFGESCLMVLNLYNVDEYCCGTVFAASMCTVSDTFGESCLMFWNPDKILLELT